MKRNAVLSAVLTAPEAAKRYRLSRRYVVKLVSDGAIQGRKAAGAWLIDAVSLKNFMAKPRPRGRPRRE
jgi:excisionase family DNA binding protein